MTKFARPAAKTATRKKTVVHPDVITPTTAVERPLPDDVNDDEVLSAYHQVHASIDALWAKMGKPSWMRELANITIGLVAYASTFYACMALVDMVVLATMAYTGVGFISFLVAFFSMLGTLMLSFKVGKIVYTAAAAFDYDNAKARVRGWLTFGPKPIATT